MPVGYDLLGLAHKLFPVDAILNDIPPDAPIGFFWNTFGLADQVFGKMLRQGRTTFRIHCYWSDKHEIVPMDALLGSLTQIDNLAKGKSLQLYVSPSCEHAEPDALKVKNRLDLVRQVVPYSIPVNNPEKGKGAMVPGYLTEYHGKNPGVCSLASTDGDNIYDIDAQVWVRTYGNRLHPSFLWGRRFNLREIEKAGELPPSIQARRAAPDIRYFKSVKRLASPKGKPQPPILATATTDFIYKSHAEDVQEPSESMPDNPRENKPCLIVRLDRASADILTTSGKVIGKLVRGGPFGDGYTRYYSGVPGGISLYGYEIGEKAKKLSGTEFVYFKVGNILVGPINPAFREGTFR